MYKMGIDLGGTNIAVGIIDSNNSIIAKVSEPTCLPDSPENIVGRIYHTAVKCLSKANLNIDDLTFIGLGTPGAVNSSTGEVLFSNNFGFKNVPLGEMISKKFGLNVLCENDANAATFGEYLVADRDKNDTFVGITIGTGIGGGVIIDGKIYSGKEYSGGELGHMVIDFDGVSCNCGRRGCYEAYASATALISQTKEAMQNDLQSKMWQICGGSIENVTGQTAFEGMRAGDKTAKNVIERYADYVAIGLVNIINMLGPDVICISGGISNEGDYILEPVKRRINSNCPINCRTKVVIAKYNNDAGIIGAANLDLVK